MEFFSFIMTPLLVFIGLGLGIFLPGSILLLFYQNRIRFTFIEFFLYSFALGFLFVDASLLVLGKIGILFTPLNLTLWYILFFFLAGGILFSQGRLRAQQWEPLITQRKKSILAIIIVGLIFFVKVFYLSGTILPTTTDLGHHLYWANTISENKTLPVYEKQEVIRNESDHYSLSSPEPIADFIIGEHLPLALITIFTQVSYFGVFPFLFLFIISLLSVIALATLTFYIAKDLTHLGLWKHITPEDVFLGALFLFGVLFSLASPEMKFVSGGVIGNLFGNFFIPLVLLALYRAKREENPFLLSLTLFFLVTLAYTHHLSTFILLYVFLAFGFLQIFTHHKNLRAEIRCWLRLVFSQPVILTLVSIALFAGFVTLPTYLEKETVQTAVGAPSKDTRTGLSFFELSSSNSALKVGASFFLLCIFFITPRLRKNLGLSLVASWGTILLIMALAPHLLFVNIPSNRIANYTSFPLSLLSLLAIFYLLEKFFSQKNISLPRILSVTLFFLVITLLSPGLEDNSQTLVAENKGAFVKQTFDAAQYLAEKSSKEDVILKDHNFIAASDTWMKLFFNRGYNYPLSRSFFKRYEDNPGREQCTLAAISTPNTSFGKQCYTELGIDFVVVNPKYDKAQFTGSPNFSLIYQSPDIAIFLYTPQNYAR